MIKIGKYIEKESRQGTARRPGYAKEIMEEEGEKWGKVLEFFFHVKKIL